MSPFGRYQKCHLSNVHVLWTWTFSELHRPYKLVDAQQNGPFQICLVQWFPWPCTYKLYCHETVPFPMQTSIKFNNQSINPTTRWGSSTCTKGSRQILTLVGSGLKAQFTSGTTRCYFIVVWDTINTILSYFLCSISVWRYFSISACTSDAFCIMQNAKQQ